MQHTINPAGINSIIAEASRTLAVIHEADTLFEARVFHPGGRIHSAYVDQPEELAESLPELENAGAKTYITLNPLDPERFTDLPRNTFLSHRKSGVFGATDDAVLRRHWLPLDFDPVRTSGTSSTSNEKRRAAELVNNVGQHLAAAGFSAPLVADSGNGYHLLYRIDLPAQSDLVWRVIGGVADLFADAEGVNIDRAVHNAARIWKLYGSTSRKGDNTPERPHRPSRIISVPEELIPVCAEILERVAAPKLPTSYPRSGGRRIVPQGKFDLLCWLARYGVPIKGTVNRHMASTVVTCHLFARCPLGNHDGDQGAVWQFESGAIVARCFHDRCARYHEVTGPGTMNAWRAVRAMYERRGVVYGHID